MISKSRNCAKTNGASTPPPTKQKYHEIAAE